VVPDRRPSGGSADRGEVQRVFENVRKLPHSQQKKIVETVDALVEQYRRKTG